MTAKTKVKKKLGRPTMGKVKRVRMPDTYVDTLTLSALEGWRRKTGSYGQLLDQMASYCLHTGFKPVTTATIMEQVRNSKKGKKKL